MCYSWSSCRHLKIYERKGWLMKRYIRNLGLMLARLNQRHVRLGLAVLTLILFVLGAGAPGADGGHGGG